MKKTIAIFALLLVSFYNYAQENKLPQMGFVGIGTVAPGAELEVVGNIILRHTGGNAVNTSISDINFIPNGSVYYNPVAIIKASFSGNNWYNGSKLSFFTSSGPDITKVAAIERLTIASNGNVGIGTTTPDATLSVNGTIHSKEVKVDLTGFPDYVFKTDYYLRSLAEVKTYIDEHKHLPEIPSALEIETNGLNLGEINSLLTKKIEELTLYLIENDTQVNTLKAEIKSLKIKHVQQEDRLNKIELLFQQIVNKSN